MSDLRTRLKGLGITEARLGAIGLGAPVAPASAATTEAPNAFRAKWDEHTAANAPKARPLPAPKVAIDAAKVFEQYRDGNFAERAYLREHCGAAVELGRRITLIESPEPPEPEAA